jgi:hypothetical protein
MRYVHAARLLFRYRTWRRVHVCVSLDQRNAQEDTDRLRRMLEALTGTEITQSETEKILGRARTLAPGLAIRCIGSTGGIDLSGLIGLLLSAQATQANKSRGLLLALDQHRDLLVGSGQLGDLLRVQAVNSEVQVDVIEAKFSTGALHPLSPALLQASQQVRSTIERLAQFSLDHPLILRTRSRLARAIVHRIHLGAQAATHGDATDSRGIVDAVLDPQVKIRIGGSALSSIHAWSLDPLTEETTTELPRGESLHIHSRETTLKAIRSIS